jgi:hypothetical protein
MNKHFPECPPDSFSEPVEGEVARTFQNYSQPPPHFIGKRGERCQCEDYQGDLFARVKLHEENYTLPFKV